MEVASCPITCSFNQRFMNIYQRFMNCRIRFKGIPKLKLSETLNLAKLTATRFPSASMTGLPLEPCTVAMSYSTLCQCPHRTGRNHHHAPLLKFPSAARSAATVSSRSCTDQIFHRVPDGNGDAVFRLIGHPIARDGARSVR